MVVDVVSPRTRGDKSLVSKDGANTQLRPQGVWKSLPLQDTVGLLKETSLGNAKQAVKACGAWHIIVVTARLFKVHIYGPRNLTPLIGSDSWRIITINMVVGQPYVYRKMLKETIYIA